MNTKRVVREVLSWKQGIYSIEFSLLVICGSYIIKFFIFEKIASLT